MDNFGYVSGTGSKQKCSLQSSLQAQSSGLRTPGSESGSLLLPPGFPRQAECPLSGFFIHTPQNPKRRGLPGFHGSNYFLNL
jgi:hypothetical protein